MSKVLFILTLLLYMLSCEKKSIEQKKEPAAKYFFRYKVNGQLSDSSTRLIAIRIAGTYRTITLTGAKNGKGITMSISSIDQTDLTPGIYVDSSTNYKLTATYAVPLEETYYLAGTSQYETAKENFEYLDNHFYLTITAISAQSIRGTFRGDFFHTGLYHGAIKQVTDGEFFLPLEEM